MCKEESINSEKNENHIRVHARGVGVTDQVPFSTHTRARFISWGSSYPQRQANSFDTLYKEEISILFFAFRDATIFSPTETLHGTPDKQVSKCSQYSDQIQRSILNSY